MSTAKLNIWIARRGRSCEIEDRFEHFVYITGCDGKPLRWCRKTYVRLRTRCGHLEVEVPPGCYIVGAVENASGIRPFGNHLTHVGIVRVNCGDHACVTLFDPTFHFCGTWFGRAIDTYLAGGVRGELAAAMQNAKPAVARLVAALQKEEPDDFTANLAKTLEAPAGKTKAKKR
jgi:hypothetical protein